MSYHRLMCVWEAAAVGYKPPGTLPSWLSLCMPDGRLTKQILKRLSAKVTEGPFVKFSGATFSDNFSNGEMSIDNFLAFLEDCLIDANIPISFIFTEIEEKCWKIARDSYTATFAQVIKFPHCKIWRIFCCLSDIDSFPPEITKTDLPRINEYHSDFVAGLRQCWPKGIPVRFNEFIHMMNKLVADWSAERVTNVLFKLYDLLVEEVNKSGYFHVRTETAQRGWSEWSKLQWVVLSPGIISVYKSTESETAIEKFLLAERTAVSIQKDHEDMKVFQVTTLKFKTMEFSTSEEEECQQWIREIQGMIGKKGKTRRMSTMRENRFARSHSIARGSISFSLFQNIGKISHLGKRQTPRVLPVLLDEDITDSADKEKLLLIFIQADKDGNGAIDRDEFADFLSMIGEIDRQSSDYIFDIVDLDKSDDITFDEFHKFFIGTIKPSLGAADADEGESQEITDEIKKGRERKKMIRALEMMDDSDIFSTVDEALKMVEEDEKASKIVSPISEHFKKLFESTSTTDLSGFLHNRWANFQNFKRAGFSGEVTLQSGGNDIVDILPGKYMLADLAIARLLGGNIEPKRAIFKNVAWEKAAEFGKVGQLVLPYNYDGSIPVEFGTRENVRYYGCDIADYNTEKVQFTARHIIQDFNYASTYKEDYVEAIAGSALETHIFHHINAPLEEDSGYFLLGKMIREGDVRELHLTAFLIPTNHTIFVPGGTIHSNDHLKGMWRIMLSDLKINDRVHLRRQKTKFNKKDTVPISFKMTGYLANLTPNAK